MTKLTLHPDGTMTVSETTSHVYTERRTCRACHEPSLQPVLDLGNQFLVNFVDQPDPNLPRAPLHLHRCSSCGLLQLGHTVNPELLYREFWYRSGINESMRLALREVVSEGLLYASSGRWLDIGANDGYLLSQLPKQFERIACEPAMNLREDLFRVTENVISDFFKADHHLLEKKCDVITSVAMFYDLDDPDRFVADIAKTLSKTGVWINQLNDSPTMLKQNAFDAVCHEHLCYYDVQALSRMYNRHGLVIVSVKYNDVNGGSVRICAKHADTVLRGENAMWHGVVTEKNAKDFAGRVGKWKERMLDLIHGPLVQRGALWCYGASTKGCALLQYLDTPGSFRAIADRNPAKFGKHMTGTWLKVTNEEEMRAERPPYALVLPWGFEGEFNVRERPLMNDGACLVYPLPNIKIVL